MILIDTNLWLYAALRETPHHSAAKAWLEATFNGDESIALPWCVVLAVLRISTQHRLMLHPLVEVPQPGPRHWIVLRRLIEEGGTAANLTSDAHLAALAIEHNCLLCSTDSDFRRFAGLRFSNPLSAAKR